MARQYARNRVIRRDCSCPAGKVTSRLNGSVGSKSATSPITRVRRRRNIPTSSPRPGKSRIFTFTMESKSVITFPSGEMKLPGAGFYEITGLAWSGRGKIARVEVSTDDGKSWSLASLQDPVLAISQTRFRFPWIWDGGPAVIQSRATDETGYLQPTHQQLIAERGPLETGSLFYHMNAIQSWSIAADGSVKNVHPLG